MLAFHEKGSLLIPREEHLLGDNVSAGIPDFYVVQGKFHGRAEESPGAWRPRVARKKGNDAPYHEGPQRGKDG